MILKPIKPKRVSAQVFEQIRELIFKGEFKPGQQIPPERYIAQSMIVSRTSVRKAISELVALGLLENRQGQGTFVSSPERRERNPFAAAMATDDATIYDVLEVRLGLECNAAMLAAERATEIDIIAIKKSLMEMEEDLETTDKIGVTGDVSYHMAITFSTKNPVLIHLVRNFYDFLFAGIKKNLTQMYMNKEALEEVLKHHREILETIERRAPKKAYDAMYNHIIFVQKYFNDRKVHR